MEGSELIIVADSVRICLRMAPGKFLRMFWIGFLSSGLFDK